MRRDEEDSEKGFRFGFSPFPHPISTTVAPASDPACCRRTAYRTCVPVDVMCVTVLISSFSTSFMMVGI